MKWLERVTTTPTSPAPKRPPQAERVEELVIKRASVPVPLVSIILPTFNEGGNIVELLAQIKAAMLPTNHSYECIFVDDSTDATLEVIRRAAGEYPGLVTIVRRLGASARTGLTQAFYRGFREARGEYIVCMDTDLQHPPKVIPELISALQSQSGLDLAIASRYQGREC